MDEAGKNGGDQSREPWNEVLNLLEQNPKGSQIFATVQKRGRGLVGFVVAAWDDDRNLVGYWPADSCQWRRFDDETKIQYPRIYRTIKGVKQCIQRLRSEDALSKAVRLGSDIQPPIQIGLAFWKHPDADVEPLEKYLRITGSRFPGSPSQ